MNMAHALSVSTRASLQVPSSMDVGIDRGSLEALLGIDLMLEKLLARE
ncbi:hypothetical protein LP415_09105 [Polaromonas sp. P1(28)-8]|nr:hypothetical protein LP415_09105 [Polaromonas sp. P1(28)-8]